MPGQAFHVVKVGGSLLDSPGVEDRLVAWRDSLSPRHKTLLIAGGGAPVDSLRQRHADGQLTDEQAHWGAIKIMDQNAQRLSDWMGLPLAQADDLLGKTIPMAGCLVTIVTVERFLRGAEPGLPGTRLPVGWQVTSDSIAARLAEVLGGRLTLLKSAPPRIGDHHALAACGYVDEHFPRASLGLREVVFQTL